MVSVVVTLVLLTVGALVSAAAARSVESAAHALSELDPHRWDSQVRELREAADQVRDAVTRRTPL